jgi:hypothetical protein
VNLHVSPQPRKTEVLRFGLARVRSPLLTGSRLISLPGATEMFQFTPSPDRTLWIHVRTTRGLAWSGCPIRISAARNGYVLLTAAFRSLSRPSSALGAKAFALRS